MRQLVDAQDRDFIRRGISVGTREGLLERATARAAAAGRQWDEGFYGSATAQGTAAVIESLGIGSGLLGESVEGTAVRMAAGAAAPTVLGRLFSKLGRWLSPGSVQVSTGAIQTAEKGAEGITRPPPPKNVMPSYDGGWKASWEGNDRAIVMFEPNGNGMNITDVFRGTNPPRSAGMMIADSFRAANHPKPTAIRIVNIIHGDSLTQLGTGVAAGETTLGRTVSNAVSDLGGRVTGWRTGVYREKPWIEATIEY